MVAFITSSKAGEKSSRRSRRLVLLVSFGKVAEVLIITVIVGESDGWLVGEFVGWLVGESVGWLVGELVGWLVGEFVGWLVGESVGWLVVEFVGLLVGKSVGLLVGESVGWCVGESVGWLVGESVGSFEGFSTIVWFIGLVGSAVVGSAVVGLLVLDFVLCVGFTALFSLGAPFIFPDLLRSPPSFLMPGSSPPRNAIMPSARIMLVEEAELAFLVSADFFVVDSSKRPRALLSVLTAAAAEADSALVLVVLSWARLTKRPRTKAAKATTTPATASFLIVFFSAISSDCYF
jgi:hypothetical protein